MRCGPCCLSVSAGRSVRVGVAGALEPQTPGIIAQELWRITRRGPTQHLLTQTLNSNEIPGSMLAH